MRNFGHISDTVIDEFKKKGFIEGPISSNILNRLRRKYTEYMKMFCSGICISSGRTGMTAPRPRAKRSATKGHGLITILKCTT